VQNLLSSILLSKYIKNSRIIILPVVLYGCETWSHTLREERRLRVFEYRLLRKYLGLDKKKIGGHAARMGDNLLTTGDRYVKSET
jgi:hypothetical protein